MKVSEAIKGKHHFTVVLRSRQVCENVGLRPSIVAINNGDEKGTVWGLHSVLKKDIIMGFNVSKIKLVNGHTNYTVFII